MAEGVGVQLEVGVLVKVAVANAMWTVAPVTGIPLKLNGYAGPIADP